MMEVHNRPVMRCHSKIGAAFVPGHPKSFQSTRHSVSAGRQTLSLLHRQPRALLLDVHRTPVIAPDAVWLERCCLNDPRMASISTARPRYRCGPIPSSNGRARRLCQASLRALMPKEEHFFDLFTRMLRSRLPVRKRSAQMRSGGEDVIRYCREIAPCVGMWPPTSSWPGSWRCRQQRCSPPPYLQTSLRVRPTGVTLPRSVALCDDGGRPVHGGVND
jgi:hypothetical protein